MAQETVADIERSKKELEAAIMRKEGEISQLGSKLEDEQSLVGKIQKSIKVLNHPHTAYFANTNKSLNKYHYPGESGSC